MCYLLSMLFIAGIDFTSSPLLFQHLQNRGEELLIAAGSRIMRRVPSPFALLVTCDRAELISEERIPAEILERALSLNPAAVRGMCYAMEGREAILHLLMLSTGAISPLFGEDTIQGQMIDAAASARLIGSSSPLIDKLMNMAVAFSKRMHSSRTLRVIDDTVVEAVRKRVEPFHDILIVGSGEMARRVAASLLPQHSVRMTLRDTGKTFLVPPGTIPVPYESRYEEAGRADAVISASSGLYYTFDPGCLAVLEGKPVFDLASPPDIPPEVHAVRIPDLGVEEPGKEAAISAVAAEAEKEAGDFLSWLARRDGMEAIRGEAEALGYEVLRRLSHPISSLGLSPEAERSFRIAVMESVRKGYISKKLGGSR